MFDSSSWLSDTSAGDSYSACVRLANGSCRKGARSCKTLLEGSANPNTFTASGASEISPLSIVIENQDHYDMFFLFTIEREHSTAL